MDRILVILDIEGLYGMTLDIFKNNSYNHIIEQNIKIITEELNCFKPYQLYIWNVHNDGLLIHSCQKYTVWQGLWNYSKDVKFKYTILWGFHPMSGVADYFAHTFKKEIKGMYINSQLVGEIGFFLRMIQNDTSVLWIAGQNVHREIPPEYKDKFIDLAVTNLSFPSRHSLLEQKKNRICPLHSLTILVEFYNSDYIKFLTKKNYKIKENSLSFDSFEEFLANSKQLALDVNWVNKMIEEDNHGLIESIKKRGMRKKSFDQRCLTILDKELLLVNDEDRKYILEYMDATKK